MVEFSEGENCSDEIALSLSISLKRAANSLDCDQSLS